jgi:hypothetical protein
VSVSIVADDIRSTKTHKQNTLRSENQSPQSSKKLIRSSTSLPDPSTSINQSRKRANYSLSTPYPTTPDKLSWQSHLMSTLGSRLLPPNYQRMGKREWCFLMLLMSLSLFWLLLRACMRMCRGSLVCQVSQTLQFEADAAVSQAGYNTFTMANGNIAMTIREGRIVSVYDKAHE